jgi:anti-sigma factor RsiW
MNQELQLKIQAYLDGELSRRQARQVAAWIAADPAAQQLAAQLRHTAALLRDNELERPLPEGREFYWSKILREILKPAPAPAPAGPTLWRLLRRYLAPVAGVALVAFVVLGIARFSAPLPPSQHVAEVENLSDLMGSYSFRSHADNMMVVWLYAKTPPAAASDDAAEEDMPF